MKNRFILDENIWIYGQLETNEANESDTTCAAVIHRIIDICHTLVLDLTLWDKYQHQLSRRHQNSDSGSGLLRVLRDAFQMQGKVDFLTPAAREFPEESGIPPGSQDDITLVRLAIATGAILVTTDQALEEDLASCGVQERYNIPIMSPAEVLESL